MKYTPLEKTLIDIIKNTFWMARRYAHGRHTYAPELVRDAYWILKAHSIDIAHDDTIEPPEEGFTGLRSDYLDDIK